MSDEDGNKGKDKKYRVRFAGSIMVNCYRAEVDEIVTLSGVKGAWVSDQSKIGDFIFPGGDYMADVAKMSRELGIAVSYMDYVWEVAKRLFDKRAGKDDG